MESGSRVGLCFTCRHARRVPTPRAQFWLCELSKSDPAYDRYPRLPVLSCAGYEPDASRPGETARSG
jgi:hypothetical protein